MTTRAGTLILAVWPDVPLGEHQRYAYRVQDTTTGRSLEGRDLFTGAGAPVGPGRALRELAGFLAAAGEAQTLFVIGGAQLYALLLPLADRLELTEVKADVEGDAHFPAVDPARFVEERRETHHADADNAFDFDFVRYGRR